MDKLFLGIFFLVSIFHLFSCYRGLEKWRAMSKVLLMPLLFLTIASISKTPEPYVYLALIFGFIGDVFLIFDSNPKFFIIGLGAFLIGHVFYIIDIYKLLNFNDIQFIYLPAILIVIVFAIFMYNYLKDSLDKLKAPVILYIIIICVMLSFATLNNFINPSITSFITFIGAILFTLSDSLLSVSLFKKKFKNYSFYIMLTYILAQFLLTISLVH